MTDLLPCPFCGNTEPKLVPEGSAPEAFVYCGKCDLTANLTETAIKKWNTRADKAAPVERIEGLKEAVEFRREIAEFGISRVDNFFGMNKEKPKLSLDTILWIAARAYLKLQGGD